MRMFQMPHAVSRLNAGALSLLAILALLSGFALPSRTAHALANTWTVNDSGDSGTATCVANAGSGGPLCQLRDAMNKAAGGDTIAFSIGSGAQTITLSTSLDLPTITNPITIDGSTQPGFTSSPLITINANNGCRFFDVETGSGTTQISALKLINGDGSGGVPIGTAGDGGAIYARMTGSGSLAIANVVFVDNVVSGSGDGGAVYNEFFAAQTGGITITDSTFTSATTPSQAKYGGAVYNNGSLVTLNRDTITNLKVSQDGAAVYAAGSTAAHVTIVNSTLDNNNASGNGGALLVEPFSEIDVLASDLVNNVAGGGGAVYVEKNGTFTLQNSIVYNNSGADDSNLEGNITSLDYNLVDGTFNNTGTFNAAAHDLIGGAFSPNLQGLANNGGPTQTEAIAAPSNALDYIPVAACAGLVIDQRSLPRPSPTGGNCDIGAFELQQIGLPTNTATNTATNTSTAIPTNTATATATNTSTTIPTNTVTATATDTNTAILTNTATATATNTSVSRATSTSTATLTPDKTFTATATSTTTATTTATATGTILTSTQTSTATTTATGILATATASATGTATPTGTLPTIRPTMPAGATSTPNINVADPAVAKSADKNLALPGDTVTFTLTVTNSGTAAASSVVVTDSLPAQLQVISVTTGQGTSTTIANEVTFAIGTVNPGQIITLTIVTKVSGSIVPPADLINFATLTWPGGTSRVSNDAIVHITGGNLPATGEHPVDSAPIGWIGALLAIGVVGAIRIFGRRRTV